MLTLIIGGAGSGKSLLAEEVLRKCAAPRLYIATMQPFDAESRRRIERHRLQREGKGFLTLECYTNLKNAAEKLPLHGVLLLECAGNLLANELFSPEGGGASAAAEGILSLRPRCGELIVVYLFAGGTGIVCGAYFLGARNIAGVLARQRKLGQSERI